MQRIAGIFLFGLLAITTPTVAQSLHGLTVGEPLIPALKRMPRTQNFGQVGDEVAIKWNLPSGNSFSATASPNTGRIVFLEEDWAKGTAASDLPIPGFVFGETTLNDIRRRFGSNGIGFASNFETGQNGAEIGINCYELRLAKGIFVAFVTRFAPPPEAVLLDPSKIKIGNGLLVSIIVAEKAYLQKIWGKKMLFDPSYTPVDIPGLLTQG